MILPAYGKDAAGIVTHLATAADPDNPTAAEIAELDLMIDKVDRTAAVNARTGAGIATGYVYKGKRFSASPNHQTWAVGLAATMAPPFSVDQTGTEVPTADDADDYVIESNADATALIAACFTHVQSWLASGTTLKKQINAAYAAADAEALAAVVDNR